jgi:hypothetical protein
MPLWCVTGEYQVDSNSFYLSLQRSEHAGYVRNILEYNPPRYDSEGDELDFDDSDATADAEAAEINPYSGIVLTGESIGLLMLRTVLTGSLRS